MVKSKNKKVNHMNKKHTKKKKTISRFKKGSRGVMHHRHMTPKNNKTPWIFKFPKTKKAINNFFGYKSEERDRQIEAEILRKTIEDQKEAKAEILRKTIEDQKEAKARVQSRSINGWGRMSPPGADKRHEQRKKLLQSRQRGPLNVSPEPVSRPSSPETVIPTVLSHRPAHLPSRPPSKKDLLSGPATHIMPNSSMDPISLGPPATSLPDFYDTVYIGKERILTLDVIVTVKIRKNTSGSDNGLMDLYLIADVSGWSNGFIRAGINSVKAVLITALDDFNSKNKDIDLKYEFGDKYINFCLKNIKFNHVIDDKGSVIIPDSTLNNLFQSVGNSLGGAGADPPMLKIHVRKDSWKQIKPKNLGTSKRSCKSNNCLQVFFYISTGLRMIGDINKTFILEKSKKHTINDDICSDVEMSKSPKEYMKGAKHNNKKKQTNKKKTKKKSSQ